MQGFLNFNKPSGCTSRDVTDAVIRCLRQMGVPRREMPKVGHAGTLDPLASGVLVIAIGQATRLIDLIHSHSKSYRGRFLLGKTSPTDDAESELADVDPQLAARLTRSELDAALAKFRGVIEQVPPQFSAVRVNGQRAYQVARRGEAVELKPKPVTIHHLEVTRFEPPHVELDIECSSGTYIRSLGRDLGRQLGCGAVMTELCRTAVGLFRLEDSVPLQELTAESLRSCLLPPRVAVGNLPLYRCDEAELDDLRHGRPISPRQIGWSVANSPQDNRDNGPSGVIAIMTPTGELLGIGSYSDSTGTLRPRLNLIAEQYD